MSAYSIQYECIQVDTCVFVYTYLFSGEATVILSTTPIFVSILDRVIYKASISVPTVISAGKVFLACLMINNKKVIHPTKCSPESIARALYDN